MSIDVAQLEKDADALGLADQALTGISDLAKRALLIEKEIEDLESTLQERKEVLRDITDNRLPEAMRELNMNSFRMADGSFIEVKPFYSASIPADRKGEAYEWLRSKGFDDIIKNTVSVQFGRGEDGKAGTLISEIRAKGLIPEQAEKIEPSTLKAFIKDLVEQGVDFDSELFGAYIGWKAKIKSK